MSRADLLALSPESLASLTNLGLVKRAQRALDDSVAPEIHEEADGTVVGTFVDGIVAQLPPSTLFKDAPCTCGAVGVCRHLLIVALAYKAWYAAAHSRAATSTSAGAMAAWSPADIDDATLERALGITLLRRAAATMGRRLTVTIEYDEVPTARLPSCTVRFLVPNDVTYARCDCADAGGRCEHLALAVWAFRNAATGAGSVVVALGNESAIPRHTEALGEAMAMVRDILMSGLRQTTPSPGRFAQARSRLEREGMTWIHGLVQDLEIALEGYHKRSALHDTREVASLLIELAARARAGQRDGHELPAQFVLGEDEAPETLLDHVRLISLGVRIRADERVRFADVYLADPDAALVLVLRKRWDFDVGAAPDDGPALARRAIASRVALGTLAHGQLVSKVVTRNANRSIRLGTSRLALTSVTPQRGDWGALPPQLLVRDLDEHGARIRRRPPRILRPRVFAEEVHVVEVSAVEDIMYSASEQKLVARLADAAGRPFVVVVQHRRVAPFALEAAATALEGDVRFVAGDLRRTASHWELDPLAIAGDDLVIPDLAGPAPPPSAPAFVTRTHIDPVDRAMTKAESVLDELCSAGLSTPSRGALDRARIAAQALDDAGLASLAVRLRALDSLVAASAGSIAADAWLDAGLRMALAREAWSP
jgi:hypothetical protein